MEVRLRTSVDGGCGCGFLWVDCQFSFSGTRFYAVFRDVSAAKKAEVRRRCRARARAAAAVAALTQQTPKTNLHRTFLRRRLTPAHARSPPSAACTTS
jgi:hypothetical protein